MVRLVTNTHLEISVRNQKKKRGLSVHIIYCIGKGRKS
jgi:hypothetical protein